MMDLKEKSKANPKKKKKTSGTGGAVQQEVNGELAAEGQKAVATTTEQELSGEEQDEVSSANSCVAPGNSTKQQVRQAERLMGAFSAEPNTSQI